VEGKPKASSSTRVITVPPFAVAYSTRSAYDPPPIALTTHLPLFAITLFSIFGGGGGGATMVSSSASCCISEMVVAIAHNLWHTHSLGNAEFITKVH
jgi:hypothetical protein